MKIKKLKIQSWKELENLFYLRGSKYNYPGANLPDKSRQEGVALQKFLPPLNKGLFLDYGCGEGAMFKYIKEYYHHFSPLIIGIDPDYSRLTKARELLQKEGGRGIFFNTTFDNLIFRKETLKDSLFCIICIQVFGHISEKSLIATLKTFHFLLEPQGVLIIAVPFINNEFSSLNWKRGTDLFCLINCLHNLQDPARKTTLSEKSFSYFADHPVANLLPTRRFFIDGKAEFDYKCSENKIRASRLGRHIVRSRFSIKDSIVYKVKSEKGSGDLMLSLVPNKL